MGGDILGIAAPLVTTNLSSGAKAGPGKWLEIDRDFLGRWLDILSAHGDLVRFTSDRGLCSMQTVFLATPRPNHDGDEG